MSDWDLRHDAKAIEEWVAADAPSPATVGVVRTWMQQIRGRPTMALGQDGWGAEERTGGGRHWVGAIPGTYNRGRWVSCRLHLDHGDHAIVFDRLRTGRDDLAAVADDDSWMTP